MKFLCDVHIAYQLVRYLQNQGHEALHVNDILQKSNTSDAAISAFADKNDFTLITKDADFRNSFFIKSTPRKLIRITLGNISNKLLIEIVDKNLELLVQNIRGKSCYIEIGQEGIMIISVP